MGMTFYDTCPICNAFLSYSGGTEVDCPHCGNKLLIGSSDPTGHDISEIDPDVLGGASGVFHLDLHPVGTNVCVICRRIFPQTFECCPALVDLALASYMTNNDRHGPNTSERIAEFLRRNSKVVTNTAQLRAIQYRQYDLDGEVYSRIRTTLESLGMAGLLAVEDRE
jgi:hypothetical protein